MFKRKTIVLILFLFINLIPHIYVSCLNPDTLLNWYLTDDAFYYFKTAQNISEGVGITFDGIAPTNGFHPLWMIFCVPVFFLARFDLFLPLRVLIVLMGIINAISGYFLYRIFADRISEEIAWVTAIFWMFLPVIHGVTTKLGLESGINALSIILLIYSIGRLQDKNKNQTLELKDFLGISVVAIICLLSRLDNIFFVLMAGVILVFHSTHLRWRMLLDFCLILTSVVCAYYGRIQLTDNIFNFLPFFYYLAGFSLIIKPVVFYFSRLYEIKQGEKLGQMILRVIFAASLASLIISFGFFVLHDLLHAFRGFPRSVLVFDWLLTLIFIILTRIFRFVRCQRFGCDETDIRLINNWKDWLTAAAGYFVPLLTVLAAYLSINHFYSGSAMPVSGSIKRWWGTLPNTVYGRPIENLRGVIQGIFNSSLDDGPLWMIVRPVNFIALELSKYFGLEKSSMDIAHPYFLGIVWVIVIAILIAALFSSWRFFSTIFDNLGLSALAAGCFIHILSYKTTAYLHVRSWYWLGEMLLLVILVGLIVGSTLKNISQKKINRYLLRGFISLFVLLLYSRFILSISHDFPLNGTKFKQYDYFHEKQFIEKNTNPGDVIGMTGGGLVGYFIPDRTVINLDGLINSTDYFEKLKLNHVNDYLEDINIKYVYGDEQVLLDSDPYRWIFTDHLQYRAQGLYFKFYDYCINPCN